MSVVTSPIILVLFFVYLINPNSSPGPSPRSKWRSEKPLAKAAEIL